MADLTADAFAQFFHEVHGQEPYPWQRRLTEQVLAEGRWPDVIDLPTGSGKTAVLDTAVFALAARPADFPRRIVFVIDRRIVVDQVVKRAQAIAAKLKRDANLGEGSVAHEVRRQLFELWKSDDESDLQGEDLEPLEVVALRGGIPNEHGWAKRPDRPAVMVSTVDQFGSRLLFRGYGTSPKMRPIHAGLAGNDCLVILDEVHLSRPFAATLREATSCDRFPDMRSVAGELPRRFAVVDMSATTSGDSDESVFQLTDDDLARSEALRQVARPHKRAALEPVKSLRQGSEYRELPKVIKRLLDNNLNSRERAGTVGVIVNRVRTAREVHATLTKAGYDADLVTGRMRPLDRAHVLSAIEKAVDPERDRPPPAEEGAKIKPRVVVATQCIEVGADFSFDALVTEIAPADSLQQRLGRLDRRGSIGTAEDPARCFVLGPETEPKKPDPIYGDAAQKTWAVLESLDNLETAIDVAPQAETWQRFDSSCKAPWAAPPIVLPTHLRAWAQTNPQPTAEAPVDLFLHGIQDNDRPPEVSICWRCDPSLEGLAAVRPRASEFLSVPWAEAQRWVAGVREMAIADVLQQEPDNPERDLQRAEPDDRLSVWRYSRSPRGEVAVEPISQPSDVRPGDIIIASPTVGGIVDHNWNPARPEDPLEQSTAAADDDADADQVETDDDQPAAVSDLGDEAQLAYDGRPTLRLDPRLGYPDEVPLPSSETASEDALDDSRSDRDRIDEWLGQFAPVSSEAPADEAEAEPADRLSWLIGRFRHEVGDSYRLDLVEPKSAHDGQPKSSYFVLSAPGASADALDGVDDDESFTGREVPLGEHLQGVGKRAEAMAKRLGLADHVVADLKLAGEIHDLGKVDARFQRQMRGYDDPVAEAMEEQPLAKSLPGARQQPRQWPPVRHELSSVLMVESADDLLANAHDPDLVLHLVATHHGHSRPLPTFTLDDNPQPLRYKLDSSVGAFELQSSTDRAGPEFGFGVADRFWAVYERYGHHGMAWLEAILRLADHRQSELEGLDD